LSSFRSLLALSFDERQPFDFERRRIRATIIDFFSNLSPDRRSAALNDLRESASYLLRQHDNKGRVRSLLLYSFLIDVENDQSGLSRLATVLEKLLPSESVQVVEGIAFLISRLSESLGGELFGRVFNRCMQFLSSRSTEAGVQSSVILLRTLSPLAVDTFQTVCKDLPTFIWLAFAHPNRRIQSVAVDLYLQFMWNSSHSDELARALVSMCLVKLESSNAPSECRSIFLIFRRLLEVSVDYLHERYDMIFKATCDFVSVNRESEVLEVLARLCENNVGQVVRHFSRLKDIFWQNWDLQESAGALARIARLGPKQLRDICCERAFALLGDDVPGDSTFFQLVTVDCADPIRLLDIFARCELFTVPMVDCAIGFLKRFPYRRFRVIQIFEAKLQARLNCEPSFLFLHEMEDVPIFPFEAYWERIFPFLTDPSEPVALKRLLVKALGTIIRRVDHSGSRFRALLFALHDRQQPEIIAATLDEIDDRMLRYFGDRTLLMSLISLIDFRFPIVCRPLFNILVRLHTFSALSSFNAFFPIFDRMRHDFVQSVELVQKRNVIVFWPAFIDATGDFMAPYAEEVLGFHLSQLLLLLETNPRANPFLEQLHHRKNVKYLHQIHISAMESIQHYVWKGLPISDMQTVVDRLIGQLTFFKSEKVALAALETLRTVVRCNGVSSVNVAPVQQSLFAFVIATKTRSVLSEVLRILGTIGSLDPLSFQASGNSIPLGGMPIFDLASREQVYFEFVMQTILDNLAKCAPDRSLLLNAILYIFQFDPAKSTRYLHRLIPILETMLEQNADEQWTETDVIGVQYYACDAIFHVVNSIVLLVDIEIEPFAPTLLAMVKQFLAPGRLNLLALKTLSALLFSLKTAFEPFAVDTFAHALTLLQDDHLEFDFVLYLLQILTHLVIFCRGSQRLFLREVSKRAVQDSLISSYAVNFLSQAISNSGDEGLLLPSLRLAESLVASHSSAPEACENLLALIAKKIPQFVPSVYHNPPTATLVAADPYPRRFPPPIRALPLSSIDLPVPGEVPFEGWLLTLAQRLVLCSNCPALRACHPLLRSIGGLVRDLFPLILLSVWDISDAESRVRLSHSLLKVAHSPNIPKDMIGVLMASTELLNRAGHELFDSWTAAELALSCGDLFRALRFYQLANPTRVDVRVRVIGILARLHRHETALGIFVNTPAAQNQSSVLEQLCLWGRARSIYSPDASEGDLVGFVNCSARMGDWRAITSFYDRFECLPASSKRLCALDFALSARFCAPDRVDSFLDHATRDSPLSCLFRAVIAYDRGNYLVARRWADRGMKINSNDVTAFFPFSYESTMPAIDNATLIEEMIDVIDVAEHRNTRESVCKIWAEKSERIKSDLRQIHWVFLVRELLEPPGGILAASRRLRAWDIYDRSCERLAATAPPDSMRLSLAKVSFDRSNGDLSELLKIVHTTRDESVFAQAVCSVCARASTAEERHVVWLGRVLRRNEKMVRALKHWAFANLSLFSQTHEPRFAQDAMNGFSKLIQDNQSPSLHYLCQMCSLAFASGTDLDMTGFLGSLSQESKERIIDQLIAQFGHENDRIRQNVIQLVEDFANEHVQAVAFPIALTRRCDVSAQFLAGFEPFRLRLHRNHVNFFNQVEIVTTGLLAVAFTAIEEIRWIFGQAEEHYLKTHDQRHLLLNLKRALSIFHLEHRGIDQILDKSTNSRQQHQIEQGFLQIENLNFASGDSVWPNLQATMHALSEIFIAQFRTTESFDIFELAPDLQRIQENVIAMPGYYSTSSKYPRIHSFIRMAKLLPSACSPRKLRVLADNGLTYSYMLKGGEDTRLDLRIMQWFSLVNSILQGKRLSQEKRLVIKSSPVIPVSPMAGMLVWTEGGDTLHSLIEWMRERRALKDCYDPGHWTSIQRYEHFLAHCRETPDNLLKETIWLKSENAPAWFQQVSNFSTSTAVMSIVGYIIGLGDRYPSNIMFMKGTGTVFHVGYNMSFDRAKMKVHWPEKVPFRLTRMIVKVYGLGGIDGSFKTIARFMLEFMRRNQAAISGFLELFARDRTGGWDAQECQKVKDKMNGKEHEGDAAVENHLQRLISEAMDPWNLSQMYPRWMPQW
jgi:hypothetical protein